MIFRKALYWWLFPSAVVLPVWVLIGWAAFNQGSGWSFLGLLVLCPILFVALIAVGGIMMARKSVRDARAVSWLDTGLLAGSSASIIAFGFFPAGATGWLAVLGVLFFLAIFWLGLWELVSEARARVQVSYAAYQRVANPQQPDRPQSARVEDDADVIIIEERRDD